MKLPEDKLDLIIEILRQHDGRFEQIDKRFEQIDKRFEQIEINRREDKRELLDAIKDERRERERMEDKLEKVYESRDRVTVNFTRAWATASFFVALIASTIVLAVEKAF